MIRDFVSGSVSRYPMRTGQRFQQFLRVMEILRRASRARAYWFETRIFDHPRQHGILFSIAFRLPIFIRLSPLQSCHEPLAGNPRIS